MRFAMYIRGAAYVLALTFGVGSLPSANSAVIASGLIGYWNADGDANDSSPTANNGTYSGAYAPGISGQAFDFSSLNRSTGAGAVLISDNAAYFFGSDFSVGFWFNVNGSTNNQIFLGQDNGGGTLPKWFIQYGPSEFLIHINGPSTASLPSDPVALPSGWNQLTLTKSGSLYSFYLDGTAIGSQSFGGTFPDPTNDLTFGWAEPNLGYNGLLDDVVIYNLALSAGEAANLAAVPEPASLAILLSGLVGLGLARRRRSVVTPSRQGNSPSGSARRTGMRW